MAYEALEVRLTHGYVGSYAHLDKWETVGKVDVLRTEEISKDEEDACEETRHEHMCLVMLDPTGLDYVTTARKALYSKFGRSGCAHEYDCCGCWSTRVVQVDRIGEGQGPTILFKVTTSSSRNY